jgi:hypothetical protein
MKPKRNPAEPYPFSSKAASHAKSAKDAKDAEHPLRKCDESIAKKIKLNVGILMVALVFGPLGSAWPMCNSRVPIREALRTRQAAAVIDTESSLAVRSLVESPHAIAAVHRDDELQTSRTAPPTRCGRRPAGRASLRFLWRHDAGSTLVTRAKWILRMAQCIPAMGAQAGARYRAQMPVRPHAALFPCRSLGLEQAMTSSFEPHSPGTLASHAVVPRLCRVLSTLRHATESYEIQIA